MTKKLILPLIILIALLTVGTAAAQADVSAALVVPEGPYTVGDPLELALTVTHPAGYHIISPELPETWGDFIVTSQSPPLTIENEDGSETTAIMIDARLFAPGEFSTPPLTIEITDGAGQLSELPVTPAAVSIASVLVEGDTELRDIKPQAEMPFLNLLPWIATGLLLAAVIGGGYLLWKRRQAKLALAAVDNRMPHEIALDDLRRIGQLGLPEQMRFKEHYTLVSDTVRLYIERTYHVPVLERTTGEIRYSLRQTTMSRANTAQLLTFLDNSDLVKFSEYTPLESEAYEIITQGVNIVENNKPMVITEEDLNNPNKPEEKVLKFSANGHKEAVEVRA